MKTAMQETAIDWLVNQLYDVRYLTPYQKTVLKHAKEKEKEQILRAFDLGMHECLAYDTNSNNYYNQTYNQTNVGNDGFEFDNSSTIPPPKTNNL
jgi:hypothetical protein